MPWCAEWVQKGKRSYLIRRKWGPALFRTKKECKEWIAWEYGYIKTRPDLRTAPHYWRLPRPVKVIVEKEPKS